MGSIDLDLYNFCLSYTLKMAGRKGRKAPETGVLPGLKLDKRAPIGLAGGGDGKLKVKKRSWTLEGPSGMTNLLTVH